MYNCTCAEEISISIKSKCVSNVSFYLCPARRSSHLPYSRRSLCSIYNDYVNLNVFATVKREYCVQFADRRIPLHSAVVSRTLHRNS